MPNQKQFKVLDLFSGAGGFSIGLESLPQFQTVVATDFMPDALKTFAYNFPKAKIIFGDICDQTVKKQIIESAQACKVNMIIGGPPCQGFSNKGKKLGLADPRNFLFKEYLDIVSEISPEIFIIENVKTMLSASNGWFFQEIQNYISKLGYNLRWGILTASDFGVPQKRQRAIIIASKNNAIELPQAPKHPRMITVRDAISDLAYLDSGQGDEKQVYRSKPLTSYQKQLRKNSKVLYNHRATNHSEIALKKLAMIPAEQGKQFLPEQLQGKQKFKTTWGRLRWDEQSPTIDTRFDTPSNGTNSHPELNRAITPREAARIQSFPDTFRFLGSKTNICKQIGNAVPPFLGKAIGETIVEQLSIQQKIFCDDAYNVLNNLISSGQRIDHLITDPPYNISQKNNFSTMKSAQRRGVDFGQWDKSFDLINWIEPAIQLLRPGGTIIIFNSYKNLSYIAKALEQNGAIVKDVLKWIKKNPMPRNITRRYVQDTEFAIWAVKPGAPWIFNLPKQQKYLRAEFHTPVVSGRERTIHPTQKSLRLMKQIIQIHTNKNELILDPFMGSGTTGVAALQLKRKFIGVELDYNFFQIAKKRIEKESD